MPLKFSIEIPVIIAVFLICTVLLDAFPARAEHRCLSHQPSGVRTTFIPWRDATTVPELLRVSAKMTSVPVPISLFLDSKPLQLGIERLVVLDPEQSRRFGFHAAGLFHCSLQILSAQLVKVFFQIEAVAKGSVQDVQSMLHYSPAFRPKPQ